MLTSRNKRSAPAPSRSWVEGNAYVITVEVKGETKADVSEREAFPLRSSSICGEVSGVKTS